MNTKIFFRFQSNKYEVGPGSISWYMDFSTIEEAMKQDILKIWKNIDDKEFYNEQVRKLENKAPVKKIWQEFVNAGYKSKWVEPGLSCFANVGDLFIYWNAITYPEDFIEEFYLLEFIGEFIDKGSDNEDCVQFVKEVERRDLEDCLPIIELLEIPDLEVDDFIKDIGFSGVDNLIDAAENYLAIYREGRLGEYELELGFLEALEND